MALSIFDEKQKHHATQEKYPATHDPFMEE